MHPDDVRPCAASRRARTLARLLAACLMLPLLVGCGTPTVEVVLPSDARTAAGASAICRGVVAGQVSGVQDGSARVATVTLDSARLADVLMRDGVKAWVLDSGDIEFDVSGVAEGAKPLPSGSRILAERRNAVQVAVQRWATGWNMTVVGVGLLAMLVVLSIAKAVLRGAAVLARLVVACAVASGVAYLTAPPLAPIIEREIYPLLESARAERSSPAPADPSAAAPTTDQAADQAAGATPAPPTGATGSATRDRLESLKKAAGEQLGTWSREAAEALRDRPLPNPVYPAFFGAWLVSFVVVASLLRKAMSGR